MFLHVVGWGEGVAAFIPVPHLRLSPLPLFRLSVVPAKSRGAVGCGATCYSLITYLSSVIPCVLPL